MVVLQLVLEMELAQMRELVILWHWVVHCVYLYHMCIEEKWKTLKNGAGHLRCMCNCLTLMWRTGLSTLKD